MNAFEVNRHQPAIGNIDVKGVFTMKKIPIFFNRTIKVLKTNGFAVLSGIVNRNCLTAHTKQ